MIWAILHYRVRGGVYVEHRVVFMWFGLSYNSQIHVLTSSTGWRKTVERGRISDVS